MKSELKTWLLIALFVGILIALILTRFGNQQSDIDNWLKQRGLHRVFEENRILYTGPYWRGRNETVYFVKAVGEDGQVKIFWFKFSWGMSVTPGRPEDYQE